MAETGEARDFMRRNIDACWPQIEAGAEAIVMTASGCGAHVRDYGELLARRPALPRQGATLFGTVEGHRRDHQRYRTRRKGACRPDSRRSPRSPDRRVAYQSPCSLQHAQKLKGVVEGLLKYAGYTPTPVAYPFMCCGSAGSYSILQPEIADACARPSSTRSCRRGRS
jgi:glycolate oxidase iron-sulfur subunit